jgi:polyisoprenoid-binding protein YceI
MAALISATPVVHAQTWTVDKAHSEVNFSVGHLLISEVTGTFTEYDVSFVSSREDFTDAVIEAAIRTASVNTGNEKRDAHLRSDDFFNAAKYPEMRFRSTSVQSLGDGRYEVTGDLTIRDVTKAVVLDTKYNGMVKDPWGATRIGFKAAAAVNRFDYGLKWDTKMDSGGLVAGETVLITLLMEFVRQ